MQDLATGIDLADLGLRIEGRGRGIALTELTARDPTGGTLARHGRRQPPAGRRRALRRRGGPRQLRVLNNDLGSVILSTDIDAAGDQAARGSAAR